jgi:4-amino-4-deoxychorismate lyase
LQYGDGVFTTARIRAGRPLLLERHLQRLDRDMQQLGYELSDLATVKSEAAALCQDIEHGVLKIIITRGAGERGYRPPTEIAPRRILQAVASADEKSRSDAAQHGIAMRVCRTRLGRNPALAGVKHLNRLEQVLARTEWRDPDIFEGLMLDSDGHVIETTQANVFFVRDGMLCTPALEACGVQGILRALVLEQADAWAMQIRCEDFMLDALLAADEVFITNCLAGVVPVCRLEDRTWQPGVLTRRFQAALTEFY